MKIINLLVLLWLFCIPCQWTSAQESKMHLFRGVVFDSDSIITLGNAKYTINEKEVHLVNSNGEFLFLAEQGDLIHFSHVGYKSLYIQVNDSMTTNKFLMGVFLSKDTIELSEVIILPQNINPNAMARNLPLMTTSDAISAQNNLNRSAYVAKTQPIKVWDADMNQKNFLQARSNDVVYKYQLKPDEVLEISTTELKKEFERQKMMEDLEVPKKRYLNKSEENYLRETYKQRHKVE